MGDNHTSIITIRVGATSGGPYMKLQAYE